MKALPFIVFAICAAIAANAATSQDSNRETAGFRFVFFGLASLILPIVIAIQTTRKENRQWPTSA